MERTTLILSALLVGMLLFGCMQQTANLENQSNHTVAADLTLYQIHEIKQGNFTSGDFNVEGYVVKIYACPQCPPDAACKPCMRDNIVISESNNPLDTYSLTDSELIVFTNNTGQFVLGGKYLFSIRIGDRNTTGEPINDIELVGYDLMK